jgi:hypothetical protein
MLKILQFLKNQLSTIRSTALGRLSFDLVVVALSIYILWIAGGTLYASQEALLRSIFLFSVANIVWYISRRLFVGKIDWTSDGDKWRKLLALVMLLGAYLIFARA